MQNIKKVLMLTSVLGVFFISTSAYARYPDEDYKALREESKSSSSESSSSSKESQSFSATLETESFKLTVSWSKSSN